MIDADDDADDDDDDDDDKIRLMENSIYVLCR